MEDNSNLKIKKPIIKYNPLYSKYSVFEVIFNPHLKKAKSRYEMFTESVQNITLSPASEQKIYISFLNAAFDDTTIFDDFLSKISTITKIEIDIADREGNIIDKKIYSGKFESCSKTLFSYNSVESFLAVFKVNYKD